MKYEIFKIRNIVCEYKLHGKPMKWKTNKKQCLLSDTDLEKPVF